MAKWTPLFLRWPWCIYRRWDGNRSTGCQTMPGSTCWSCRSPPSSSPTYPTTCPATNPCGGGEENSAWYICNCLLDSHGEYGYVLRQLSNKDGDTTFTFLSTDLTTCSTLCTRRGLTLYSTIHWLIALGLRVRVRAILVSYTLVTLKSQS